MKKEGRSEKDMMRRVISEEIKSCNSVLTVSFPLQQLKEITKFVFRHRKVIYLRVIHDDGIFDNGNTVS